MKYTLLLIILLIGCSRNGEYRYVSELALIEPAETLIPRIQARLRTSDFRAHYDQTLLERIGSSFTNFKHIRGYQAVLEDALIYLMIKTDTQHLGDGLRNALIPPVSKLILGTRSGDDFLAGLDDIAQILRENSGADRVAALSAYNARLRTETR